METLQGVRGEFILLDLKELTESWIHFVEAPIAVSRFRVIGTQEMHDIVAQIADIEISVWGRINADLKHSVFPHTT